MTIRSKSVVVKDNRLVEAAYRLTLIEQFVVLLAIVEARETNKGFDALNPIKIRVDEFAKIYNLDINHAYHQLKEVVATLFEKEFTIRYLSKSGNETVSRNRWVGQISYNDGDGTLSLVFSGAIVPYITQLEQQFTNYELKQISGMTSVYGIRLFELMTQWGSVGHRTIEVERFKEIMMLEDKYSDIKNLRKRVLDPGVKQVNEYSNINVEYAQRKTGRSITHFDFKMEKKEIIEPVLPKIMPTVITPQPTQEDCFLAATIKISKANQTKFLKIRTPDEIQQCIAIANQNIKEVEKKGGQIKNVSAYYATAIRDGWHLEQKEQQKKQEQNNQEEVKKREQIASAIEAACRARGIHELNIYNRAHGIPLINL